MATPTGPLTAEIIAQLAKEYATPRGTLLLSSGYRDRLTAEFPFKSDTPDRNPLYAGTLSMSYASIGVRCLDIPKRQVLDWSGCRSPSRAKRRHARGIPQRVKVVEHDVAYLIDERVLTDFHRRYDRMCAALLFGGDTI